MGGYVEGGCDLLSYTNRPLGLHYLTIIVSELDFLFNYVPDREGKTRRVRVVTKDVPVRLFLYGGTSVSDSPFN